MEKILTPFDPPEKTEVCQDLDKTQDIWSLGVTIFQTLVVLQDSSEYLAGMSKLNLRELSYDGRVSLIKE